MKEISAGGVVFREKHGRYEILMIKDRFEHWTLPKGKQEPGETVEETALREIEEETGIKGEILRPLVTVQYTYEHPQHGETDKVVHYFLVKAMDGTESPQLEEIDDVTWLTVKEALSRQALHGYSNNQEVMDQAVDFLTNECG
ncbi:MAG: NUDIX hydrolase [Thermoactinomyces vulgaris]|uniref:NUDIX hydrolase n=1 Tax=Thermoactinomyces sp. FSL K6-2592 TaxID=2975347 RepID=UPI0030FBAF3F